MAAKSKKTGEERRVLKGYTLPSFAIDDGSEAHCTLASVTFLLLGETFTKFPGNPVLENSDDFFPTETLCLPVFSCSSIVPLATTFFIDV